MSPLRTGDFAPDFTVDSSVNPAFHFATTGGRRVVLTFFGTGAHAAGLAAVQGMAARRAEFEGREVHVFPVTADPDDRERPELVEVRNAFTFFWDTDGAVHRRYGMLRAAPDEAGRARATVACVSFVLNENSRIVAVVPVRPDRDHAADVLAAVAALPAQGPGRRILRQAPVLLIPDVLDRDVCRRLIAYYEARGGVDSGFMTERDGRTVGVLDYRHKRRRDCTIEDEELRGHLRRAVERRIWPEIKKAFAFGATRMERYIVACYDGNEGGHFRAHRDNTTKGTAHRRFAVTVNLNAEEYEGGDLRFPEYGRDVYRAETGGAVVFSCSLMHEATPVTSGRRYAFLPFLYDEEAARIREENQKFVQVA